MRPILCSVVLACLSVMLVACEQKAAPSTIPTMPAAATDTTSSEATLTEPTYAGTYIVQDTAVCALSIIITKQVNGYTFTTGAARGQVQVEQQGSQTYFTFIGLKGVEPQGDIEAVWQDSMLIIQNYGNTMNEYTRFEQCDAKYLELVKQQ